MNATIRLGVATVLVLFLSAVASADSVSVVYTCELRKDKTLDDAHAINVKWLKFVNENGGDGNVSSSTAAAIVGEIDKFFFIDSYPDLKTWAVVQEALNSDDSDGIEEAFDDVMKCDESQLYAIRRTE